MCRIFIIIPTYNAEHFLSDCLNSLINQTVPDWRAAVVDDGSSDGSLEVARRFARQDSRIEVHSYPNGGVAVARNRGKSLAPSEARYVLFIDNDDFLDADTLEVLASRLDAEPNVVAAYGLPRTVNRAGQPSMTDINKAFGCHRQEIVNGKLRRVTPERGTSFASFVIWCCIATPGQVLIRSSALKAAGDFDAATVPSDDWDMWLRLSAQGDFAFLPRFVINKRQHGENVSSKGKIMAVAEPALRKKLAAAALTVEQHQIARAGHRSSCLIKLQWAASDFKQGRVIRSVKTVYRALRSYSVYRQTWAQ